MNENIQKANEIIGKVKIIYNRIVVGTIIIILLFFVLFDTAIIRQTIRARNFIEAKATFVEINTDNDSKVFDECIYTFEDKNGKQQEITTSISKNEAVKEEIIIKYNEKDPQDFYEEGQTFNKSGIIWYIVKVVILILLLVSFFNKSILNKINLSFH